jgi:hypothetical protein
MLSYHRSQLLQMFQAYKTDKQTNAIRLVSTPSGKNLTLDSHGLAPFNVLLLFFCSFFFL